MTLQPELLMGLEYQARVLFAIPQDYPIPKTHELEWAAKNKRHFVVYSKVTLIQLEKLTKYSAGKSSMTYWRLLRYQLHRSVRVSKENAKKLSCNVIAFKVTDMEFVVEYKAFRVGVETFLWPKDAPRLEALYKDGNHYDIGRLPK